MGDLITLKGTDMTNINPQELIDISDIELLSNSKEGKVLEYLEKIKNPYCFLCDGYIVKLGFADSDITITDRLCNFISRITVSGEKE